MKFTLSWLKKHLETDAVLDDILYALTDLGLEVEDVVNPLTRLADFTIGHVVYTQKHPNADKLRVCTVITDKGELQIICGAPNVRAGIYVVVAQPGVYVPGIDKTISVGKIRGIESYGMVCSEREMELSDEHDSIIELEGTPEIGQKFVDYLANVAPHKIDPIIEIAITPNRPDALGVRGIARDLAARGLGRLKPCDLATPIRAVFESDVKVTIDRDTIDGCPVFAGRMIRNVKNGPSPMWLQSALRAIGLRPISFLVDVTNYYTFDQNRPMHVFDADKLKGDLRVHRAKGGEIITALDEKNYTLENGMIAISAHNTIESIAGIMGGYNTSVTDKTVNIFVESAYWDPVQIAATGRKLKINSDARYRFERGVDPAFTLPGLDHAVALIQKYAGGEASELVLAGKVPDVSRSYSLDTERVKSLVGMDIPADNQVMYLRDLGFEIQENQVKVPSWRPDILGEADLVEEVARIASLTKLSGVALPMEKSGVTRPILSPMQKRVSMARRTMAMLGYNECVTYSFIDHSSAVLFGGGSNSVMINNPIASDMSHMRPSLLPNLLHAAARNQARGNMDIAFFEIGSVFHGANPEDQEILATGLLIGHTEERNPHGGRREFDFFDAKADVQAVLSAIGAPQKLMVMRGTREWWHPGRSGKLSLGPKNTLAAFGALNPKILKAFNIKGQAVAFAIHLANIPFPKAKLTTRPALKISDLQAVDRDFSFVLDHKVESVDLLNAAKGADKLLINAVSVFDVFDGDKAAEQLGEGKKSIAITVRLQPRDVTLTDQQIETVCAKIIDNVYKKTKAVLRR